MPGHPLLKNCHANALVETLPTKRLNIVEVSLFDLLPMNIIIVVDYLIIRSKYKDKHTQIISQFTRQPFPVICTLAHKHRKPHHNYGPLQLYGTIIYKWDRSIDNMCPLGIYMKHVLTKNEHE